MSLKKDGTPKMSGGKRQNAKKKRKYTIDFVQIKLLLPECEREGIKNIEHRLQKKYLVKKQKK